MSYMTQLQTTRVLEMQVTSDYLFVLCDYGHLLAYEPNNVLRVPKRITTVTPAETFSTFLIVGCGRVWLGRQVGERISITSFMSREPFSSFGSMDLPWPSECRLAGLAINNGGTIFAQSGEGKIFRICREARHCLNL
jgi:hypothetical protein